MQLETQVKLQFIVSSIDTTVHTYLLLDHDDNNDNLLSISLRNLQMDKDERKYIAKYKETISEWSNTCRIFLDMLIVQKKAWLDLPTFIKQQLAKIIIPPCYHAINGEMFIKRFITQEIYNISVRNYMEKFVNQITHMKKCSPSLEELQPYQNFIQYVSFTKYRNHWKMLLSDLLHEKLQPSDDITNYFPNMEIKELVTWLKEKNLPSVLSTTNDKLILSPACTSDHAMLAPYLLALFEDGFTPAPVRWKLLYSCFAL